MKTNFWKKFKKPITALAPMAGITDSPFRQICKSFGADVVYTEMISADGVAYESKKAMDLLKFAPKERPVVLQLFGKNPDNFRKAVKIIQADKKITPDGFDINFGCPARKVAGHGGGVALLRDLELCWEIVRAVCDVSVVPVSVKTRTSISRGTSHPPSLKLRRAGVTRGNANVTVLDFLEKIEDLPISAVMIHGRSYEQGFSGDVDFEMIKKVVEKYGDKWVIIGNGGLNSAEDVKEMIERTGVDGVGLARGVYGRPWLFGEITCKSTNNMQIYEYANMSWAQIKKTAIKHAKLAYKCKSDHGIVEMRKHLAWYVKGRPDARGLRRKLVRVETMEEIEKILEKK